MLIFYNAFDKNRKHVLISESSKGDDPVNAPPICVLTFDLF